MAKRCKKKRKNCRVDSNYFDKFGGMKGDSIMKAVTTILLILLWGTVFHAEATGLSDLLPRPALIRQGKEELRLPDKVLMSVSGSDDEMRREAQKMAACLCASGIDASVTETAGFVRIFQAEGLPPEGYRLKIDTDHIEIEASDAAGLFYAFQTFRKLLPPHVMAGVAASSDVDYIVPTGEIEDYPRYCYRGFMLDVSRHFFDIAQIKKMLDLMAAYKLNKFHWHLTDDQGWRLPVAGYPELTAKGAVNKDILRSDYVAGKQWREGEDKAYGPYAYSEDEIRDVVGYAADRHIEVIPEVDMPGHTVAAIHAYPFLSTDEESLKTALHLDFSHEIWNKGGVSRDVLDVSNPRVMRFAKDVIDAVAALFPSRYIHIGGDECPTLAWEHSGSCRALADSLGYPDVRGLQSFFTKQIAQYALHKHGRRVMGWNELITEGNVDMEMIKVIDPVIFCWIGGEKEAEENGLSFVYTPFNGGYYINRSYKGYDQIGAVKDGALATTIRVNPPESEKCIGVQGTFWTEQVDRNEDLEYLALPRLIGIAEQGWSKEAEKDYSDFLRRVNLDTDYLRLAGFNFAGHQLMAPEQAGDAVGK